LQLFAKIPIFFEGLSNAVDWILPLLMKQSNWMNNGEKREQSLLNFNVNGMKWLSR
jgi:hypothetical protein